MSTTDHTPTAAEVAEATEHFRASNRLGLTSLDSGPDGDATVRHAATLVRAALAAAPAEPDDAHTETVTEWRVTATTPKGERVEFWHRAERPALDQAAHYRRWAWSDVRVESRTVTTSRRESEWKATDQ